MLELLRKETPKAIRRIVSVTDEHGRFDTERFIGLCARALRSPRELRSIFAS